MAATCALDGDAFVIDGYTRTKPFASFLPGISGLWGIPMWAFYVNRGQAIAGFGIQDKDHPVMEFLPANRAYRAVPLQGFRTFLKVGPPGRRTFYEPFQAPHPHDRSPARQRMRIRMHDLLLEDEHPGVGLATRVHYFTIPHSPFAALARVVTLTNRSRRPLEVELLDGLPTIIPYGVLDRFLKQMSRTIEAWVAVDHLERGTPFFRLKVEPDDRPEVVPIRAGNFYVGFSQEGGRPRLAAPVVDPALIFGFRDDLTVPERYLAETFRPPKHQATTDKTPCAMGHLRWRLGRGESRTLYSLFGHIDRLERLDAALPAILTPAFFAAKAQENESLIRELTEPIATRSGLPVFDRYCRQTFLDNLMRGGTPTLLGDPTAPPGSPCRKIFYVFGRKHGDLERDYNEFLIPPTPFSQGNANFRDVNQNRRTDVWFHPEVDDQNVVMFFNLLQPDGFNPLIVRGLHCLAPEDAAAIPQLKDILSKPFTPGELLRYIVQHDITLGEPPEAFLNRILTKAAVVEDAEHGEGFWTDHWTYNLDLLESYLALYPERLRQLLLEKRVFTFYDNAFVVVPRALKYQQTRDGIRQFHAVRRDPEKATLIRSRTDRPHCVRTDRGRGEVYATTLLVKMVCVIANKLASLDPSGIGIEMEANKPDWYDALNGLPGLLGSSVCETFELKRWLQFLDESLTRLSLEASTSFGLPEELHDLVTDLEGALERPDEECWDLSAGSRERYRERTRLGFSGQESPLTVENLRALLRHGLAKAERGIAKTFDRSRGLYASYFFHEVSAYRVAQPPNPAVTPTRWNRHALPVFLEGMVHALRLEREPARARALHRAVKKSPLYDKALRMYRVCDSLSAETPEIGRCRIFTPGWLEHQSIWLHMEYKYLLELLRCGLYEEFYEEFFSVLIPFQPPGRYGRSILENSSFLVSSVYPDRALHGSGFVARLSGATAELLQMWLWLAAGRRPFRVTARGALEARLEPVLPAKLFDGRGRFNFRLLGATSVTYHNPLRRATFGPGGVAPGPIRLTTRSRQQAEFRNGVIPAPYAEMLRRGLIETLEVDLIPCRIKPMHADRASQRDDKADTTSQSDLSAF